MKDSHLELNLPIIKNYHPAPDVILSMDEYIEFVQFGLQILNQEAYWEQKKIMAVDVPFRIE